MRCVIQRVSRAKVSIRGVLSGEIGKGLVVLVGMKSGDDYAAINYIIDKIINMRVFEDDGGKMNLSVNDCGGSILIVPNFTLYGDARKGRRPSYADGAPSEEARVIFDMFYHKFKEYYNKENLASGVFQEDMELELINDGPVTILLDSEKLF